MASDFSRKLSMAFLGSRFACMLSCHRIFDLEIFILGNEFSVYRRQDLWARRASVWQSISLLVRSLSIDVEWTKPPAYGILSNRVFRTCDRNRCLSSGAQNSS